MPLPALLLLTGTGIALLWFNRFQRAGKLCVSLGWLPLVLLSLQPVTDNLLKPTEDNYPTWCDEQPMNYVVVLDGGYTWNSEWMPSSDLTNNSLLRLTEGIRLWQVNPGSKMIFIDAAAKTNPASTVETGARVMESLGVPRSDIIALGRSKDTEEGAQAVKRVIGDAPFLLVTSASHLPRAMIFFRHAGLDPLPAPANQLTVTSPLNPWGRATPSPVRLMHSGWVGYETLDCVQQWLKGGSGEPGQE